MSEPALPKRLFCTEIAAGERIVEGLFRRKFDAAPPADPHHLFVVLESEDGSLVPVSYVHFMPLGDICLVGGGCTDGRAFSHLSDDERQQIQAMDGVFYFLLRYGFERFADRFSGFFGYCGDARAESVDLRAGFEKTEHEHLLKLFPKPLHPNIERALIAKAHALGPF